MWSSRYATAALGCAALAAVAACASASPPGLGTSGTRTAGDQPNVIVSASGSPIVLRPADEKIPDAAKAVTISQDLGPGMRGKPAAPATVTDPARVRELTAAIAGLAAFQPGTYSCPAGGAYALELKFSAAPGETPLAVAIDSPFGCPQLQLKISKKPQATLWGLPAATIFKIAGLSWTVPAIG